MGISYFADKLNKKYFQYIYKELELTESSDMNWAKPSFQSLNDFVQVACDVPKYVFYKGKDFYVMEFQDNEKHKEIVKRFYEGD
jgi:hypothetical protein